MWCSVDLWPGVIKAMHVFQLRLFHVRIDLRRGDIGVSQQFLDDSEVRPTGEKMSCEAVS